MLNLLVLYKFMSISNHCSLMWASNWWTYIWSFYSS